jgi:hypothetical protein
MTYPGKGTTNDVLKADAQSLLRYQTLSTPVTVASGVSADYTSVSAALVGGAKVMSIIGDTFETATLAASDAVIISLEDNVLWDLGEEDFTGTNTIDINGNGRVRYSRTVFGEFPFALPVNIDGLEIINASTVFAAMIDGAANSKVSNCNFVGDAVVSGSGTQLTATQISGDLIILTTASGCNIQQVNMGGVVIDSGNNTVLSNVKFN